MLRSGIECLQTGTLNECSACMKCLRVGTFKSEELLSAIVPEEALL